MGVNMFDQIEMQFPAAITRNFTERCSEYATWLKDNRSIYTSFRRSALKLIATGRAHYGARALAEGIRLETYLSDVNSDYKINNNIVALLSRHFSLEYPQHGEFFKYRQMIGEPTDPVVSEAILKNALRAVQ